MRFYKNTIPFALLVNAATAAPAKLLGSSFGIAGANATFDYVVRLMSNF